MQSYIRAVSKAWLCTVVCSSVLGAASAGHWPGTGFRGDGNVEWSPAFKNGTTPSSNSRNPAGPFSLEVQSKCSYDPGTQWGMQYCHFDTSFNFYKGVRAVQPPSQKGCYPAFSPNHFSCVASYHSSASFPVRNEGSGVSALTTTTFITPCALGYPFSAYEVLPADEPSMPSAGVQAVLSPNITAYSLHELKAGKCGLEPWGSFDAKWCTKSTSGLSSTVTAASTHRVAFIDYSNKRKQIRSDGNYSFKLAPIMGGKSNAGALLEWSRVAYFQMGGYDSCPPTSSPNQCGNNQNVPARPGLQGASHWLANITVERNNVGALQLHAANYSTGCDSKPINVQVPQGKGDFFVAVIAPAGAIFTIWAQPRSSLSSAPAHFSGAADIMLANSAQLDDKDLSLASLGDVDVVADKHGGSTSIFPRGRMIVYTSSPKTGLHHVTSATQLVDIIAGTSSDSSTGSFAGWKIALIVTTGSFAILLVIGFIGAKMFSKPPGLSPLEDKLLGDEASVGDEETGAAEYVTMPEHKAQGV